MIIRTKNFHPDQDTRLVCTCGHYDCDRRSLRQSVLDKLQMIRDDLGQPMVVTSGGRCPNHPNELNKTKEGDHQKGYAVDVACKSEELETKLKVLAGRYGATRVAGGAYCGFVHLSWVPTDRKDVATWSYK